MYKTAIVFKTEILIEAVVFEYYLVIKINLIK